MRWILCLALLAVAFVGCNRTDESSVPVAGEPLFAQKPAEASSNELPEIVPATFVSTGIDSANSISSGSFTVTISGYDSSVHGTGACLNMAGFNGSWNLSQIGPGLWAEVRNNVQIHPLPPGWPVGPSGHPSGARVLAMVRGSDLVIVLGRAAQSYRFDLAGNMIAEPIQYVPLVEHGISLVGNPNGTGTIMVNAYPGDPRRIDIQ